MELQIQTDSILAVISDLARRLAVAEKAAAIAEARTTELETELAKLKETPDA